MLSPARQSCSSGRYVVNADLCPRRRISFDGFVNSEGRRFGVPYTYVGRVVRVMRKDPVFYPLNFLGVRSFECDYDFSENRAWVRKDSFEYDLIDTNGETVTFDI